MLYIVQDMRIVFVVFFKQKTAYEMRISDWSSTCALPISKLKFVYRAASSGFMGGRARALNFEGLPDVSVLTAPLKNLATIVEKATAGLDEIGRASCRERVCQYV